MHLHSPQSRFVIFVVIFVLRRNRNNVDLFKKKITVSELCLESNSQRMLFNSVTPHLT